MQILNNIYLFYSTLVSTFDREPRSGVSPLHVAGLCLALACLGPSLALPAESANAPTRLEAKIVDDATGEPLATRVAITNAENKFVEIEGKHDHVQYLGKRWCYVNGSFAATIPPGEVTIEIRRGFETLPLTDKIGGNSGVLQRTLGLFRRSAASEAKDGTLQRTYRLRHWIDMAAKGYVKGDIHAHLPVPKEAHVQMLAEDLNALTLLHMADREQPPATNKCFTGKLDARSTPGCEIYVGQEIREWQMGHIALMNLTSLVPGYPDHGGTLEHWKSHPHWDLMRALRAARKQNGTIFWSHISSLPGQELPIALALGLVDGVELITWSDPTHFPNHWGPWENSGFSNAEFPVMRSMDLYYEFLNAGFRVPIAAGTDKFGEEIPLGSNRVYARAAEPTYAAWLEAVKAGKGFVTNGPIVELEIDGHQPGDVVEFTGTKKVKARVTARSILRFGTLDIMMNGRIVGHKIFPVAVLYGNPPKDGIWSMEVETEVELTESSWLAARVIDHPDLIDRILPRNLTVFAHTSPVYFLKDGAKVRKQPSIDYLEKYVQGTLHWLDTNPNFHLAQDAADAHQAAEQALEILKKL